MKTQIVCDVANSLAKQSEELKTLASETHYYQNLIMDEIQKTDSSVANFSGYLNGAKDCCTAQAKDIEINQQLLEKISDTVANVTGLTFENGTFSMALKNASGKGKIITTREHLSFFQSVKNSLTN